MWVKDYINIHSYADLLCTFEIVFLKGSAGGREWFYIGWSTNVEVSDKYMYISDKDMI